MKTLSPKSKKWVAGILLAVLIVVVAFGIAYFIKNKSGAATDGPKTKELVQTFVDSFNKKDFEAFCGCYIPDDQALLRQAAEKIGGGAAFFDQNYASTFNSNKPYQNFGDQVTLSVSDMKANQEDIVDGVYNGQDMKALNVTDVYTVNCTLTTKGSLSQVDEQVVFVCVKIKNQWYILNMYAIPPADTSTNA